MILGAHRATAGGRHLAFASGESLGCQVIQIFTSSPRQWKAPAVTAADLAAWDTARAASSVDLVVAHDSYLINLAAQDDDLRAKSSQAFTAELVRCQALAIPYLVTHPGAHTGAGDEVGLERFAASLRAIYEAHPELTVTTLLETTAGQGTTLGWRFEQLAVLLAGIDRPDRIAVCLDTCHVFAAGYDFRDPATCAATFDSFDATLGLERLKVIHLNDSKGDLGCRVDRHEQIGEGFIGDQGFRLLLGDERLAAVPMLVETPDLERHGENLQRLRRLRREALGEENAG